MHQRLSGCLRGEFVALLQHFCDCSPGGLSGGAREAALPPGLKDGDGDGVG